MAHPTLEMIHGLLYGKGLRIGRLGGLGRVVATMMGKRGDRIPFMGPQMHDHAMTIAQVPARRFYFDAELLVDVHLAVGRWYGFDTCTVVADAYNFEVEALGAKMIYSDHAMPTVDSNYPLIRERADLDKLGSLDPSKGRIPMGVEVARLVVKKAPGPFSGGFFCSPFSFLCQAMGYPGVIRALRRDEAFARDLFAYAEDEAIFPYLKAQAEAGVKQSVGADAWAAFPHVTPELVEGWVIPSRQRLMERGKKDLGGMSVQSGAGACDYCEEDIAKFDKEIMFKCWAATRKTFILDVAFSGMGRTQDWNMEWLQEFAVEYGKPGQKLPIFASLNARFMRDSTPEQIVAKIREWIDIMGRDGRLLFFIGNIPADTPPISIHTTVHAVHTLGRYPIAADLASIEVGPPRFQPFDEWLKDQPEAEAIFKARES